MIAFGQAVSQEERYYIVNSQKIYFYIQSVITEKYRKRIGGVEWKIVEYLLGRAKSGKQVAGIYLGNEGTEIKRERKDDYGVIA